MPKITTSTDILAVVVLYNSPFYQCNTYRTLLSQEPNLEVYVYDNSPCAQHQTSDFSKTIHYISDPSNPGLSFAYNRAFEYAKANDFQWMILLDQDTIFTPQILTQYIEAINHNDDCKMFVVPMQVDGGKFMSPVKKRFFGAKLEKKVPFDTCDSKKYCVINSGMMINVDAYQAAGRYNEKVFLDFSDNEFIEQFSRHFSQFFVLPTICKQEFSNQVQTKEQKLKRFNLFCRSIKYCHSYSFKQKISYICIVIKRTLSLTIQTKSFAPFIIFIKSYL